MNKNFITVITVVALIVVLLAPMRVLEASAATKNSIDVIPRVSSDYDSNEEGKPISVLRIKYDNSKIGADSHFTLALPTGVKFADKYPKPNEEVTVSGVTYDPNRKNAILMNRTDYTLDLKTPNVDLGNNEYMEIPLYVKVDGAEGELKVTVDGRDSDITSGSYTIGFVSTGYTITSVDKKSQVFDGHSFTLGDASTLRIEETSLFVLNDGGLFHVVLPFGVKWNSEVTKSIKGGIGNIINEQTLQLKIQTEPNRRVVIDIPLLVSIDGFFGELQAQIIPMNSKVTEEKITFAHVTGILNGNVITFPKAKVKLGNFRYENSRKGYILAKIDLDLWIEEEPPNKIDWSVFDFFTKWILKDGREIMGGHITVGSSLVEIKNWNKVTIALEIKDDHELTGLDVVDPLDRNNVVRVKFEGKESKPGDSSPPSSGGGGGSSVSSLPITRTINVGSSSKITFEGVTIHFDSEFFDQDIIIKVEKLRNVSNLPIPSDALLVSEVFEVTKDILGNFIKNVTITIAFDQSKYNAEKHDLAVFWFNEIANEWIKLDTIQVDIKNSKISGEVNHFTKFAVLAVEKEEEIKETEVEIIEEVIKETQVINIRDISGHWAEDSIKMLIELGAINGYADRTFKPDRNITRAEFASILLKALNLEYTTGKVFVDTQNHWAQQAITTLHAHSIVNGFSKSRFGADDPINREQMVAMLVKALALEHEEDLQVEYKDQSKVSPWAVKSIETAIAYGILGGYNDGTLKPQANTTRAEAVTIIVRGLNIKK